MRGPRGIERAAAGDKHEQTVAVIVALRARSWMAKPQPGAVGGDTLAAEIRDARLDDSVAAVVLRIDSPGGSMFASEVIYDEIEALKADGKPLVASMSSVAASGGYYIAMPADEIWAQQHDDYGIHWRRRDCSDGAADPGQAGRACRRLRHHAAWQASYAWTVPSVTMPAGS